jgi:3-oxoacyl-[acyl-carrier protein] reductase
MATVLITGASRGIGKASARIFAEKGYDLILTCKKNIEDLKNLADDLSASYSIKASAYVVDQSDADAVLSFTAGLPEIDIFIANAGISKVGLLQDMSVAEWQEIVNVNLSSLFYYCKGLLPGMIHRGHGHIIPVSSVWGNAGASCEVAYSATKGGINAFTKALAKEVAPSHINVNAVAFGYIDTEMNREFSKEEVDAIIEEIPMNRIASAQEAAEMIYGVCQLPAYTTGQIFTMDGGWI